MSTFSFFHGKYKSSQIVGVVLAFVFVFGAFLFATNYKTVSAADDCSLLGGAIVGTECQVTTNVGNKSGTFNLDETLHLTSSGKITVLENTFLTININNGGDLVMDTGSEISSIVGTGKSASAITINIVGDGTPNHGTATINGSIISKSARTGDGNTATQKPGGGQITVNAACNFTLGGTGKISSEGQDPGADLVHLQAGCDMVINGLVQSTGVGHAFPANPHNHCDNTYHADKPIGATACVEIWAGNSLVIDHTGSNVGQVTADSGGSGGSSGTSWADIFARGTILVKGTTTGLSAIHTNGNAGTNDNGGVLTIKSETATVTLQNLAAESNALGGGGKGGTVNVEAYNDVVITGATIKARGTLTGGAPAGGHINIRSYNGSDVSDASSVLDVTGKNPGNGTVSLIACGTVGFPLGTIIPGTIVPSKTTSSCGGSPSFPNYVTFPICLEQPKDATLIVIKHVINDNNGTAVSGDFTMTINGITATGGNAFAGEENPGTTRIVTPGSYFVTEAGPAGYTESNSSDCTGTILAGETKTCTITNDDIPPSQSLLIVKKVLINDDGGTAAIGDFSFQVNGGNAISFEGDAENDIVVDPGTYSVIETPASGYATTYDNCSELVIPEGGTATCTITNNDIAPTLKLIKTVVNDNGGTAVPGDFQGQIDATNASWGIAKTVSAGTHTASEINLSGYAAGVWGGDCAESGSITLGLAENKTCTITNDDIAPQLTVIKHVINDNGGTAVAGDFTMNVTGTNVSNSSFVGSESGTTITLNAGAYTADEVAMTGYTKSLGADCSGTILVGETTTCTITNDDQPATLIIVKDATPNDLQDFTFTRSFGANFILDDDAGVSGEDNTYSNTQTFSGLPGNANYTVAEIIPNTYWSQQGIVCVKTGTGTTYPKTSVTNGMTVNLGLGASVTCTFLNSKQNPTRTLGFWQTHTAYTTSVFNAAPLSGSMFIGNGTTHKGPVDTIGKVFGAFYSSIPKKTVGGNRTSIDKARMQLLQQLVAAKLNCANFGCSAGVQTMITAADAAYAGTSESTILSFVGQVDAYNNSGDTLTIGNAGSATPTLSKSIANLSFWDLP